MYKRQTYDDPDDIQLNDAEFKAIFDTARELRIPVTAHAYGPRLMKKLMGFGITGIEHGSLMDEESAEMFEQTGTYLDVYKRQECERGTEERRDL